MHHLSGAAGAIGCRFTDQPHRSLLLGAAAPLLPYYRPRARGPRRMEDHLAGDPQLRRSLHRNGKLAMNRSGPRSINQYFKALRAANEILSGPLIALA